jgi:hypothetical protein
MSGGVGKHRRWVSSTDTVMDQPGTGNIGNGRGSLPAGGSGLMPAAWMFARSIERLGDAFADFGELFGKCLIECREQETALLRKGDEVRVIPLSMPSYGGERHRPGAVQFCRNELISASLRDKAHQAQGFRGFVERWEDPVAESPRATQDLEQSQLSEGSDSEWAVGEEAMRPFMVLVLGNDQRSQSVRIQQVGHASFSATATSAAVTVTPSLRASGIPWRVLIFGAGVLVALRISSETASSSVIFLSRETARAIRAAAGLRSNVIFMGQAWHRVRPDSNPSRRRAWARSSCASVSPYCRGMPRSPNSTPKA